MVVKLYRNAPSVKNLAEWKKLMRATADATDSEIVSDATRLVDGHRAFTHVERYPDGVVWANMEINVGKRQVLTIAQLIDPGGEDLAQSIMDSVRS